MPQVTWRKISNQEIEILSEGKPYKVDLTTRKVFVYSKSRNEYRKISFFDKKISFFDKFFKKILNIRFHS